MKQYVKDVINANDNYHRKINNKGHYDIELRLLLESEFREWHPAAEASFRRVRNNKRAQD